MNKILFLFFVAGLPVLQVFSRQPAPKPKGQLFIIGGGHISDSLRAKILTSAGWKQGDIIVAVTLASALDSAYFWINEDFKKLTGSDCFRFDSAAAQDPENLAVLKKARVIYFGGGDQARFMRLIENTGVKQAIIDARNNGTLVAGTSAGAAVMSRRMITGRELQDSASGAAFKVIKKENL